MNGINSSPPSQFSPPAFLANQAQQRQQYSFSPSQHSSQLSINPSFVNTIPSHFQHHQLLRTSSLQQTQGTLSPYALQSPPNGPASTFLASPVPTSSFYAPLPPPAPPPSLVPPGPTPEQKKEKFMSSLRPLLQPTSFTGAGAVLQLSSLIDDFGSQEVDPSTRFEILTKIRDNAGNHYFRAWAENEVAMDITKEWLKLACSSKGDAQLVETIMPLLHVGTRNISSLPPTYFVSQIVDRLPLSIDILKNTKIAKIIVRFVKEPPAPGKPFFPVLRTMPIRRATLMSLRHRTLYLLSIQVVFLCVLLVPSRLRWSRISNNWYLHFLNAAIKDMASNIERKIRQIIAVNKPSQPEPKEGGSCPTMLLSILRS